MSKHLALSHAVNFFGLYGVDDANFVWRAWIHIFAQIFLCQLVDAVACAFLGDVGDAAADFNVAVRILRIDDCHGDARIAANVEVLLASTSGVEDQVLAVEIKPDGRDLGRAVRHESAERSKGLLAGKKIAIFVGDVHSVGHEALLEVKL